MVALRTLASVIFAAIFLSIFASLYLQYQSGSTEANFRRQAEQLAQQAKLLADQDVGASFSFDIVVPSNCELRFEGNSVVIVIGEVQENFDAGIAISGPALSGQQIRLVIERAENGVAVSV
ncbi:MAG: hypothetical protein CEE41_02885 [Hadesarchaea archaeon B3_Hades]|nr:MAG: hypothetical protein CEE41_02885 [Hadesarchaea archaeon B3_Hades]